MKEHNDHSVLMVAGEASGDLHGAGVVRELLHRDPSLHVYGVGGVEMQRAGLNVLADSSDIAVTGFFEVFFKLKRILSILRALIRSVDRYKPSVAILIDCPDFNFRLAKKLYKKGIPVVYYISPQVWAWRKYRVHFLKKYVSKMLVVFPFEVPFYRSVGMDVEFVGHPLVDRLKTESSLKLDPDKKTVALLPGSRKNEVHYLLKSMLKAAQEIQNAYPNVQFLLPVASTLQREEIQSVVDQTGLPITLVEGQAYSVLAVSDVAICCSGTATLETAISGTPMVVLYRMNPLTYFLGALFFSSGVQFFALPNVIAARRIVPELIQSQIQPKLIAENILRYLRDPHTFKQTSDSLRSIRAQLGEGGVAKRVVNCVYPFLTNGDAKGHRLHVSPYLFDKKGFLKVLHRLSLPFLYVASALYGLIVKGRRYLYWINVLKKKRLPAKVVSVGNITVGGTGKTPFTIFLAQSLQKMGKRVAVISRGYKRKSDRQWDCVSDGTTIHVPVKVSGDEPRLMAEKLSDVPIYVGSDRYQAAHEALNRHAVDLCLLDDGFQHLKLDRDFDFLTFDVTSNSKKPRLIPLGRYREPLNTIKRASCIVLTRTDHVSESEKEDIQNRLSFIHPNVSFVEANYRPLHVINVRTKDQMPLESLNGKRIYAFAGIGNPRSFKYVVTMLKGDIVGFKTYRDHFRYEPRHVRRIYREAAKKGGDVILTTEKDLMRFPVSDGNGESLPLLALVVQMEITQGKDTFREIVQSL